MDLIIHFFLFLVLIFVLNFFRKHIAHSLQKMSYLFFRTSAPGVIFYSIFFLLGVTIHELSHLLTAEVMGIKTGRIRIFPEEIRSGSLKMGSVESVAADPFREALIGAAPFLVGITLITAIVFSQFRQIISLDINNWHLLINPAHLFLLYLIFSISNTMYVSKEDQRAWWILPIVFFLIGSIIYVFNLTFTEFLPVVARYFHLVNLALAICVALDILFTLALLITQKAGEKITGSRVVSR